MKNKGLKRPIIPLPPIKKDDGTWAKNGSQKAELFAD